MSGDNSKAMKIGRAYKRLLISIIENMPEFVIMANKEELEQILGQKIVLAEVHIDAKRYQVHYQSGRAVLISSKSSIGFSLLNDSQKAQEEIRNRIIFRNVKKEHSYADEQYYPDEVTNP